MTTEYASCDALCECRTDRPFAPPPRRRRSLVLRLGQAPRGRAPAVCSCAGALFVTAPRLRQRVRGRQPHLLRDRQVDERRRPRRRRAHHGRLPGRRRGDGTARPDRRGALAARTNRLTRSGRFAPLLPEPHQHDALMRPAAEVDLLDCRDVDVGRGVHSVEQRRSGIRELREQLAEPLRRHPLVCALVAGVRPRRSSSRRGRRRVEASGTPSRAPASPSRS